MLRRTPLRRTSLARRRKPVRRVNAKRRAFRRERDFGEQAAFVREQPCCVCTHMGWVQDSRTDVHHEPPRSCGGRDRDTMPLCRGCHRRRHEIGTIWFSAIKLDWRDVVRRMRAREVSPADDSPVSPMLGGPL